MVQIDLTLCALNVSPVQEKSSKICVANKLNIFVRHVTFSTRPLLRPGVSSEWRSLVSFDPVFVEIFRFVT